MSRVPFFWFCFTAGLSMSFCLRISDKRLNCSQPMEGLDDCRISGCFNKYIAESPLLLPTRPVLEHFQTEHLGVGMDQHGLVPVVTVKWALKSDASIHKLSGSQINIVDEGTNESICLQYLFSIHQQLTRSDKHWTFPLNGVVIEPGHTYMVSVFNLPERKTEKEEGIVRSQIKIPGCEDKRIHTARVCRENGSLWAPTVTTAVSVDRERRRLSITVGFETAQYSERYQVSIQSHRFNCSKNVLRENRTFVNVTLEFGLWELSQCELLLTIQPFFKKCKTGCWRPKAIINYCQYYPPRTLIIKATLMVLVIDGFLLFLLWRAVKKAPVNISSASAKEQSEGFQVQERKRVLIIYSLDHPLYRNIVLKFCAFLVAKCGTEVVLDLLDSARLGELGSIQWLDWHREQIESSSDKILILCSPGVQAKWKAMCGDKRVFLREEARSPIGDMITPALSLMVPHFIRSASFEKYIVAYFDDVCSDADVPSPFHITVRYKIMKQFEELFFRILEAEKHQPGKMNCIEGLSEQNYPQCPSGRALCDAIEAFQAYQQEHPQWFEDELLGDTEMEAEPPSDGTYENERTTTNLITYSVPDPVIGLVKTKESDFFLEKLKTGLLIEQLKINYSVESTSLI